jgi:Kef-type K+ transport system membrane component KefB
MTDAHSNVLPTLFLVFVAAQIGSLIARRLHMPAVVGEIMAGCCVGPFALNLIQVNESVTILSELGAILLLFSVGLETRLMDLKKVGKVASYVGTAGVFVPFLIGSFWASRAGHETPNALFIGAAFVATSAGITAQVLRELGALNTVESHAILGAAVIDDILAMLILGAVTSLHVQGTVDLPGLVFVIIQALGFVVLIAFVGTHLMRSVSSLLDLPTRYFSPVSLSLSACLALAVAANYIGLAAIIGAFLAGMVSAESSHRPSLEQRIQPITSFLAPYFFVLTGAHVDLWQLRDPGVIVTVLIVSLLAILSKVIPCTWAASSLGRRSSLIIGIGMVPRGEVGIIVASLGLQAGVFPQKIYGVIILMSLITSIVAPPALKALFAGHETPLREPSGEPCEYQEAVGRPSTELL